MPKPTIPALSIAGLAIGGAWLMSTGLPSLAPVPDPAVSLVSIDALLVSQSAGL